MQNQLRTILITGCNRGLGWSLVEKLIKCYPQNRVIMTSRDSNKGIERYETLKKNYPNTNVVFKQLDVSNTESILNFTEWFAKQNMKLDILVHNAGKGIQSDLRSQDLPSLEDAIQTLEVNFFGVVNLDTAMFPFLSDDAKIIVLSSMLGELRFQKVEIQNQLSNDSITFQQLKDLADLYLNQVQTKKNNGFSNSSYNVSKALVNAYVRFILSKKLIYNQNAITCSPGWCQTDMGGYDATKTAEEGIEIPLHLMFNIPNVRDENVNGKFFQEGKFCQF